MDGIHFRRAGQADVEIILEMMRALENADPGDAPFDAVTRRSNFAKFVNDDFGATKTMTDIS